MKSLDIMSIFRQLAPERFQSSWDNSGIQVIGEIAECSKVGVCLEPTPEMIRACLDWGAEVVLTHHPLYMKPKGLGAQNRFTDVVRMVMRSGAWLYAAHTSLDCTPSGPAFWLGERLDLNDVKILDTAHEYAPVEVSFYSPRTFSREEAEMWTERPGMHSVSQSAAGEVRLVCDREHWAEARSALEFTLGSSPEYYIRALEAPGRAVGFGQVGNLPEPLGWDAFMVELQGLVDRDVFTVCGPVPETVSRVAYCGGSGASLVDAAAGAGADVFVTGDMKYHQAVETPVCVVDVGHFSLEEEMMRLAAQNLAGQLESEQVEVRFFRGTEPFGFHVRK